MRISISLLCGFALLLSACSQQSPSSLLSRTNADQLLEDAEELWTKYKENSRTVIIGQSVWPESVQSLSPRRVYVSEEGVYICIYTRYVTESGFFILSAISPYNPSSQGDPSYQKIQERIYWYDIQG